MTVGQKPNSRDPTDILLGILDAVWNSEATLKGVLEILGDILQELRDTGSAPPVQPVAPVQPVVQPQAEEHNQVLNIFDVPNAGVPRTTGATLENRQLALCNQSGFIGCDKDQEKQYTCLVPGCYQTPKGKRYLRLGHWLGDKPGQWTGVIGHIGKVHKAAIMLSKK